MTTARIPLFQQIWVLAPEMERARSEEDQLRNLRSGDQDTKDDCRKSQSIDYGFSRDRQPDDRLSCFPSGIDEAGRNRHLAADFRPVTQKRLGIRRDFWNIFGIPHLRPRTPCRPDRAGVGSCPPPRDWRNAARPSRRRRTGSRRCRCRHTGCNSTSRS